MPYSLMPIMGIDNVRPDEALQVSGEAKSLHVKEAVNVDINQAGRLKLRAGGTKVSPIPYTDLWYSELHGDTFALLLDELVRVNTSDWSCVKLGQVGTGLRCVGLNNKILFTASTGLFIYDGNSLEPLTIETPPSPTLNTGRNGGLEAGRYTVAISWVGHVESAASDSITVDIQQTAIGVMPQSDGHIDVTLPYVYDKNVSAVRVYVSSVNGTEMKLHSEHPPSQTSVTIDGVANITTPLKFAHMAPMPVGRFMKYWNGRLLSADKNLLRFSEALTYHLHDERYGYVALPQRITFVEPVEGGIWVGQSTNVIFLRGTDIGEFVMEVGSNIAPAPNSAIIIKSDLSGNASNGGSDCVVWLSQRGYLLGTPDGQTVEYQSKNLQGITASNSCTVRIDERLITVVN